MRRLTVALTAVLVGLGLLVAPTAQGSVTTEMRRAWGPNCTAANNLARVTFPSGARITVNKGAAEAFTALATTTQAHNYHVRPTNERGEPVTGAYVCRRITNGTGVSLHGLGIAADLNWDRNPYGRRLITDWPPAMVRDIEGIRTNSGRTVFRWGGRYSPPGIDAMHVELIQPPAVMASGINWSTVARGGAPVPAPVFKPGVPVRSVVPAVVGGTRATARPKARPATRSRVRYHTHRHCHRDRRRPRCHTARHRINSGHHR